MTENKKEGVLKRFLGIGKSNCCSIHIEEVKEETQDKCSEKCCGSAAETPSQGTKKEKSKDSGSTGPGCCESSHDHSGKTHK